MEQTSDSGELADSRAAIRRALEQADRGEGIPLDEAMRRLQEEFPFTDPSVQQSRNARETDHGL